MSDTTTPFNPATLPYKLDSDRYRHAPLPVLHTFMCDLNSKVPNIRFVAGSRTYTFGEPLADEFDVYNGTEKVGRLWAVREFDRRSSENVMIYNISSHRIQNQRGQRNRKYSKHYGVVLKAALDAFAEVPEAIIAEKIIDNAGYRVKNLASSAVGHASYCVRGYEMEVLEYFKSIEDEGPSPIPQTLIAKLSNWRDRYSNARIAKSVTDSFNADNGIIVKFVSNEEMLMVDLTNKNEIKRLRSSYDLPPEYQDKITMLKMMELNQPIESVGAKIENENVTYFYMPSGAVITTC
jgi:hypothetical protein